MPLTGSGGVTLAGTQTLANKTLTSPVLTGPTVSAGNLVFGTTGQRITGDMSNATPSLRVFYQTSVANGNTQFGMLPNGTGVNSSVTVHGNSDPDNASVFSMTNTGTLARLSTNKTGTGTEPTAIELRSVAGLIVSLATSTRVITLSGQLVTLATAAGGSGLNLPQGTAPTSPANGDVWMTSAGMFYRANGVTVGPLT